MESLDSGKASAIVKATMGDAIAIAASTGKTVWNTIKAVGPFIIAQWDRASLAQVKHNGRVAMVEIGKEILKRELDSHAEVSRELLSEYGEATPKRKVQIQKDLEYLDQRVRQIKIGILAIGYAPTNPDPIENPKNTAQEEISPHWTDRFNELARVRNEDWREDLLARALAVEAALPGQISPRVLWFLGTLEESVFRAFETVLNLCTAYGEHLFIPSHESFLKRPIPGVAFDQPNTLGRLLYLLMDTGVLADSLGAELTIPKGVRAVSYGSEHVLIESANSDLAVHGVIPTALGQSVGSFCQRKHNPLGKEIMDTWLKSLDKTKHAITPSIITKSNQSKNEEPIITQQRLPLQSHIND